MAAWGEPGVFAQWPCALATEGIQRGHMNLHARSVALSAGAPPELVTEVARRLVQSGDVKARHAERILADIERQGPEREG